MNVIGSEIGFALELAGAASAEIMPRYRACRVEFKTDGTEVTDADRAAEEVLREMISRRYPRDGVLGEEFGESGPKHARRVWVLDPIDGTASFTLGVPLFGTLIALCENDEPIVGIIHFPALNETVFAERGGGCWFKSSMEPPKSVHVASTLRLNEATVSASGVHGSNLQPSSYSSNNLARVIDEAKKFRFVSDCMQHALVARGRMHAALDTIMKPWDIAAIVPCVEEAGGVVTTIHGERNGIVNGGSLLSSCSVGVHEEVLRTLRSGSLLHHATVATHSG